MIKIKELVSEVRKWYFTEFILLDAFVSSFDRQAAFG